MNEEFKIVSTFPANPGWWLEYVDPPEDGGEKWYQPVVAWSKCCLRSNDGSWKEYEGFFPVVDGMEGMLTPDITGEGMVRYLPDVQFTPGAYSGAYYPVAAEAAK